MTGRIDRAFTAATLPAISFPAPRVLRGRFACRLMREFCLPVRPCEVKLVPAAAGWFAAGYCADGGFAATPAFRSFRKLRTSFLIIVPNFDFITPWPLNQPFGSSQTM